MNLKRIAFDLEELLKNSINIINAISINCTTKFKIQKRIN
jgi:hypothetical protein